MSIPAHSIIVLTSFTLLAIISSFVCFAFICFLLLTLKNKKVKYLVLEMSYGQMLEDVQLAVGGRQRIEFLGRSGGGVPNEEQIIHQVKQIL